MPKTKLNLTFKIKNKANIETILSSSKNIPEDELHVSEGSNYAKKLKSTKGLVSLALVAVSDERFGVPNYTIDFISELKVVYKKHQPTPLILNNGLVKREKKEFRHNKLYPTYDLCIISPPIELFKFLNNENSLNPYAAQDRPYTG